MPNHLYLCGFMGSGKTTIGQEVGARLGRPFYDTDERIVVACGRSIAELFATEGEPYFRTQETATLVALAKEPSAIVATGGGLVINHENVAQIKQTGTLLYLDTPFALCYERICGDSSRPNAACRTEQELRQLYDTRAPIYRAAADLVVDGAGRIKALAAEIIQKATQH